ncbi:hypothetical protein HYS94_05105 [Candidatus Daviesbacteria bacterium]|nr:hypothetical protein [Candidatus Daviesbacteria bacterium]
MFHEFIPGTSNSLIEDQALIAALNLRDKLQEGAQPAESKKQPSRTGNRNPLLTSLWRQVTHKLKLSH